MGYCIDRVYFLRSLDNQYVKIGCSRDIEWRLKILKYAAPKKFLPFVLIGSIPGGFSKESALHRQFSSRRVEGEWYQFSADIQAFLAGLKMRRPKQEVIYSNGGRQWRQSRKSTAA